VFRGIHVSGRSASPAAGRHCKAPPELAKAHLIKRIGSGLVSGVSGL